MINIFKKIRIIVLSIIVVITSYPTIILANDDLKEDIQYISSKVDSTTSSALEVTNSIVQGNGFEVEFNVINKWDNNYNGELIITNTQDKSLENWELKFDLDAEINNIWEAKIVKHEGNTYQIKNMGYNQDIEIGQSIIIGFTAQYEDIIKPAYNYQWILRKIMVYAENYSINYKVLTEWNDGFNGEIQITNNTDKVIEDWQLEFDFAGEINQFWTAEILEHTGSHYIIKNMGYNANIDSGETLTLGFTGKKDDLNSEPYQFKVLNWNIEEEKPISETVNIEGIQNTVFTSSRDIDSIVVDTKQSNIVGNVWTNGGVKLTKGDVNIDGICQAVNGIQNTSNKSIIGKTSVPNEALEMPDLSEYSPMVVNNEKQYYYNDQEFNEHVYVISNDIVVDGDIIYNGQQIIMDSSLIAVKNVLINSEALNSNNDEYKFIYSMAGDITLNVKEVNLKCVLYAPNGTVNIIGDNINLYGKIFANKVSISGEKFEIKNEDLSFEQNDVILDAADVTINYYDSDCYLHVTNNVILPTEGTRGSCIKWESNNPEVLNETGVVTRPNDKSVNIELVAHINKGKYTMSKAFNVKVIKNTVLNEIKDNTYEDIVTLNNGTLPEIINENEESTMYIMGKYSDIAVESPEDAIRSLNSLKSILKLEDAEKEFVWETTSEFNGDKSYRLRQIYKGIKVCGNKVVIDTAEDGEIKSLYSEYSPEIRYAEVDVCPKVDMDTIVQHVKESYGDNVEIDAAELVIYAYEVSPRLAWCVSILGDDKDNNYIWKTIFIDATNGKLIYSGNGYANGGVDKSPYKLGVVEGTGATRGRTKFLAAFNPATNSSLLIYDPDAIRILKDKHYVTTTSSNNFNDLSYGEAVDAYLNLKDIYQGFSALLNVKGMDGKGGIIEAHVGCTEDNAMYENGQLYFGRATQQHRAWCSVLDIVAHEYTHGYIDYKTGKIIDEVRGISGSIEEAYCDTIGGIVGAYRKGVDDWWSFGEGFYSSAPYRALNDPINTVYTDTYYAEKVGGKNYINPDNRDDFGGVHANSTIISHIFYQINQDGISKSDLLRILNRSLNYWDFNKKMHFETCINHLKKAAYDVCMNEYGKSGLSKYQEYQNIINKAAKNACIYKDIKETDWFYDNMSTAIERGYIKGYPDGTAKAEKLMKVSEFIAVLSRVYDKDDTYGMKWLPEEINSDSFITREQAAYIIWTAYSTEVEEQYRMSIYEVESGERYYKFENKKAFSDQEYIADKYFKAIQQLYVQQVINGEARNDIVKLNPKGYVSRAVCCSMIIKALKKDE